MEKRGKFKCEMKSSKMSISYDVPLLMMKIIVASYKRIGSRQLVYCDYQLTKITETTHPLLCVLKYFNKSYKHMKTFR